MPKVVADAEGRIRMKDETGAARSVTREEYAQAIRAGYTPQTAEEAERHEIKKQRSTGVEQLKTVGEGALRGATFGLGTAALAELGGEEYREAANERSAENPNLALAGEIGGAVVPSLFTGGAGVAGSLARATPAALAGRAAVATERAVAALSARAGLAGKGLLKTATRDVLKGGAGAGLEGAAYGMGSSLADAALEDTEWTAERALAGAADGGLYGLTFGGAFGLKKAVAKSAAEKAARFAVDGMRDGTMTLKKAIENWAEERGASVVAGKADDADHLIARLTNDGTDAARIERISEKVKAAIPEGGSRAEVAAVARGEAEAAAARKLQAAGELRATGLRVDPTDMQNVLSDAAETMRAAGTKDHLAAARKLETLGKRKVSTLEAADALHADVEQVVAWASQSARTALPDLEKAARGLSGRVDEAAASAGPEAQAIWSGVRQEASDWKDLAGRLGSTKLTDAETGKLIGVLGLGASLATGTPLPSLAAAGVAFSPAAREFVANRGGAALSWIASRAGLAEKSLTATAKKIAGGDPIGAIKGAIGGGKASPHRSIIDSIQTYPVEREHKKKSFEEARKAVYDYQANPASTLARIEKAIAPIAHDQPEVAVAMAQRVSGDYAWLASKLPVPMSRADTSLTPVMEEERLPAREQIRFANYAEALSSPMSVFASIANGHVNWDGIEALKARRPDLWNSMRFRVIQSLNEVENPPPFRKRIMLGLAFDFSSDWSMGNVRKIQATYAMPPDTGNGKPAMANVSTDAMAMPSEQGPTQ